MATWGMKIARFVLGRDSSRNPADTKNTKSKSATSLKTEVGDVGSHACSKVGETLNCNITAVSLAIRTLRINN